MKYYSIRVLEAENKEKALESVKSGNGLFIETDSLSDVILDHEEFLMHGVRINEANFVLHMAMKAFSTFLYQAERGFIEDAWGKGWMADHLQSKLNGFINREPEKFMSANALIKWHQELDQDNQRILYTYILERYGKK